jgi:hypothetical protein
MPTVLPRLNVTMTQEQHQLLLQLSSLSGTSGAGFLKRMLDEATPMLRALVPVLDGIDADDPETEEILDHVFSEFMADWRELGYFDQLDLLDYEPPTGAVRSANRSERSERGRATRRAP